MNLINTFHALVPKFYQERLKSHRIVELARVAGVAISSKTVMKLVRIAGVQRLEPIHVGRWAKRHGHARNQSGDKLFWKNRLNPTPTMFIYIGTVIHAWISYVEAGLGELDLTAIVRGQKPP